jgi:competence protein ComEA
MVIWLVAAALALVAAVKLLGGSDPAPPAVRIDGGADTSGPDGPLGGGGGSAHADRAGADLYVHVAGAVRRPGLIRLPSGTRVATALDRAGGPTRRADLTLVNLAARVQDGQQILVPIAGQAGGAPSSGTGGSAAGAAGDAGLSGATAAAGVKIHLSTATIEQLDEIDGIGPTLAERIVEYRDAHGGFRSIQELAEVEGIGEKRLATLREALQP